MQWFEESRSRSQKDCVSEHILCSSGIGAEPQQAEKSPVPRKRFRVIFRVCGYTCIACQFAMCKTQALLANFVFYGNSTEFACFFVQRNARIWLLVKLASNAYGAPCAKKHRFQFLRKRCFSACWENPNPSTLQILCRLRIFQMLGSFVFYTL